MEFNDLGTKLIVCPYTANVNYWQVYFDTNKAISDTFRSAGFAVPSLYRTDYQYAMDSKANDSSAADKEVILT